MMVKHVIANKKFRIFLCIVLALSLLGVMATAGINGIVIGSSSQWILSEQDAATLPDVDCVLVLGCLVKGDGVPSDMLHDRLRQGVELYRLGAAPKLLMSGDHGRTDYDEVYAMKSYAVTQGVPSEDIFMDHAGFSTYESMYRARDIFGAKRLIIVTQRYHLYRAVYIARSLGLEAWGVASDYNRYEGQLFRDVREILARVKDFGTSIFQPEPTYLGQMIPIFGDGNLTNDDKTDFN